MYSVSYFTVGQKGTERTPTSLVHVYLLPGLRTAMECMVFRSARCILGQTAGQLTLAGPGQLRLGAQVSGLFVLAVAPSAARTVLMVLTAAATADHEAIVT